MKKKRSFFFMCAFYEMLQIFLIESDKKTFKENFCRKMSRLFMKLISYQVYLSVRQQETFSASTKDISKKSAANWSDFNF